MNTSRTESRSIVVEQLMPHPPAKVWRALTQSWLMKHWLMENDFVLELGRRFTVRAAPRTGWSGVTNCEVLAIDEPRLLSYRWGDGTESDTKVTTVVTWTLTPQTDGTLVRMEQSGFKPEDELAHRRLGSGWWRWIVRLEETTGSML